MTSHPERPKFDPHEQTPGGGYVDSEVGFVRDSFNAWTNVTMLASQPEEFSPSSFDRLAAAPVDTYENYLIRVNGPEKGQALIQATDANFISEFNSLVEMYNSQRERVTREKDLNFIKSIAEQLDRLLQRSK